MKPKLTKKLVIICSAAAVVLAAGIMTCFLIFKKPVIAFYGLNERQKKAVVEQSFFYDEKGKPLFKFVELDSTRGLEKQLKKCKADLLFAFDSSEFEKCAASQLASKNEKIGIERKFLSTFTDSINGMAGISRADKAVKIPFASDFFSFAADSAFTNEFGYNDFNSLGDVERFLRRSKPYVRSPLVFAGAEECFAIDLLGVFCEAVSGVEQYKKAAGICAEYCKSGKRDAEELVGLLCGDEEAPLYEAYEYLNGWYKEGYFSKDTMSMRYGDVYEMMSEKLAPLVILPLSRRRAAARDIVKTYISFFVPSEHYGSRAFYAPTLCMLCRTKNEKATDVATRFALSSTQESFSSQSGLAPVVASCATADRQADDVRYWVAASAAPLAGLGADAFTDTAFAAEVSTLIGRMIAN